MDESDLSLFGNKKNKHDKADASPTKKVSSLTLQIAETLSFKEKLQPIVSRPTRDDTYNCDHPYIGVALILNHKEVKGQNTRVGTEKDRDDIRNTLDNYGFDVRVYNDLTFAEITDELKASAKEDYTDYDCFVLVVMSHGSEGKVYARDMAYPVERLWFPFLGNSCPTLINKPKLFFVQACRGENLEHPVMFSEFSVMSRIANVQETEQPAVITYAIPSTADMVVFYSTFEKYFSFRNVEAGSWFIQCLCSVLNAAVKDEAASEEGAELLRLLTAVNRKVAYEYQSNARSEALNQKKEMPNFMSTLTKSFYLKVKSKPRTQKN